MFQVEKKEKYSIISVQVQKLDATNAPELKSQFVHFSKTNVKNIILDLGVAKYCDSSGLSAILIGNRMCKVNGGIFVISSLQPSIQKLIQISQLNTILNITPTLNEAIDMVIFDQIEKSLD